MKILIVHNKYRFYGGEDTVVAQEYHAYQELGHQVEIYEENNESLSLYGLIFSFFNISSAIKFKKKIVKYNPDIIHVHNFIYKLSPSIFWVIPKNIKVYLTVHNYRFLCPSGTLFYKGAINLDSKTISGIFRNIFKGVYQNSISKTLFLTLIFKINFLIGTFKRIDKFIFLTSFSKQIHFEFNPKSFKNCIIKPNFLVSERSIKICEKEIDIIFIGRFTEEKGISFVIETLIKFTNFKIHLVGDGPLLEHIKLNCQKADHIVIHGKLNRDDALNLLCRSKYLLFPSLWYEGMPMTILEAYSLGVPVISMNHGAMKTMVINERTGFLYQNIEELNSVIENSMNHDLELISQNCLKEFEHKYSYNKGKHNLNELILKSNASI
jgi:glycosyltransferase involved in cell wall biosynthesis